MTGKLPIFFSGDSLTTILAFRGNLSDVSIRTAIGKTMDNEVSLLTKFPTLEVFFTWVPGNQNPSDYNSKVNPDPVTVLNSDLWSKGPAMYLSLQSLKDGSCGHICDAYCQFIPHEKLTEIEGKVDVTPVTGTCC